MLKHLIDLAVWLGCFALVTVSVWLVLVIGDLLAR